MNRKIRSGLLTLVAAIFALAVVIAPTRAMAVETVVADDSGSYSTPYGTISYIPDANGYNLTVEVYVNFEAEPVARVQLPKVANGNGSNHNLGFEPADGLYYHGGAGATYSYELITSAGGTWTESTDNLYFNTIEDTQKNYDNVLRINLFTFSVADRALLAVSAFNRPVMLGDNNPHDHVEGYIVTYTDYDPVTQQNQTYSFEVRDTEAGGTIDFVDPPIPQGKDIDITLICDEGYEAALWQSGTALSTVVGDEGTADNAGIAPDQHHAQQGAGNLAEPPETSEHEKRGRYQPGDAQAGHVALTQIAEKIAEHIEKPSIGGSLHEAGHTGNLGADTAHHAVHGFSGLAPQLLDLLGGAGNRICRRFSYHGIAHNPGYTLVRGQLLPAYISDGCARRGGLDRLPGIFQRLRGVQDSLSGTLARRTDGLAHTFHGFAAVFQ